MLLVNDSPCQDAARPQGGERVGKEVRGKACAPLFEQLLFIVNYDGARDFRGVSELVQHQHGEHHVVVGKQHLLLSP